MKKWINYLFWKRTWFRICFILFPIWVIPIFYLFIKLGIDMTPDSEGRHVIMLLVICVWILAVGDNRDIDNPELPDYLSKRYEHRSKEFGNSNE